MSETSKEHVLSTEHYEVMAELVGRVRALSYKDSFGVLFGALLADAVQRGCNLDSLRGVINRSLDATIAGLKESGN